MSRTALVEAARSDMGEYFARRRALQTLTDAAGNTADGLCLIEVWESMDDLQAFFQNSLAPAQQEFGLDLHPTIFEIHTEIKA